MSSLRLLHLAGHEPVKSLWTEPFKAALNQIGEFTLLENAQEMPVEEKCALVRSVDVALTGWCGEPLPVELVADPGSLRYVCNVTGTVKDFVPRELIAAGMPVTNWGDALAFDIGESALALLLACLKDFRPHIETKRSGGWRLPEERMGSLRGLRLGLYGFGVIGRKFAELCRPFGPEMIAFDPFVDSFPSYIDRADSLEELFASSQAVAIHAALTSTTHHSVTAAHLAMLPDHGIIVNTARGAIIDQAALFAELSAGRLRASLDVVEEDEEGLPADHPARQLPNLVLTAHQIQHTRWTDCRDKRLVPMHEVCLSNLKRFVAGKPLKFLMDLERYDLST